MRRRIQFYETKCRRCGKPITTTSRSLLRLDNLKAKYGSICEACMSEDEQAEMLNEMGKAIIGAY